MPTSRQPAAPVSVLHAQPVSQPYAAPALAFHTPGPVFHALPASAPYATVSTFDAPAPAFHALPAQQPQTKPGVAGPVPFPALPPAEKLVLPSKRPEIHLATRPSQPAPAPPPTMSQGPLAEVLADMFRATFTDHPKVQAKNGGKPLPMPTFSVPLPKEVNIRTDIIDGDNDIVRSNLPYFALRLHKETHSIHLQLTQWTLKREWYPNSTLND